MVIMNPIMCQAVLEDEGSMENKANNCNNKKKSVSPSPLRAVPWVGGLIVRGNI